ncbi:MAG: hypothetical protein H8M99_06800 [Gloeobacteraceae cyanobacterium ES-bin-144]|nr:hypothetical protein [Verrucomicrobiales bacterium]
MHHLLLQKSNGTYFLCLWNDVDGWDEKTKRDIENPEQAVGLTFAKAPSSVTAHLPLSEDPQTMKTSIQTGKTLTVKVPDHPLILEITP